MDPIPVVWDPRWTPTHVSMILRFYPHSTWGSQLQLSHCVNLLLSLTNILFNLFIMLLLLLRCNKTSCVFTSYSSFIYLFFLVFIFWIRMLVCNKGITSRAFVSSEKTMGGFWFWCGRIQKFSWPLTLTEGVHEYFKIFWFYTLCLMGWLEICLYVSFNLKNKVFSLIYI